MRRGAPRRLPRALRPHPCCESGHARSRGAPGLYRGGAHWDGSDRCAAALVFAWGYRWGYLLQRLLASNVQRRALTADRRFPPPPPCPLQSFAFSLGASPPNPCSLSPRLSAIVDPAQGEVATRLRSPTTTMRDPVHSAAFML